jgi:Mce-associated membrane protein
MSVEPVEPSQPDLGDQAPAAAEPQQAPRPTTDEAPQPTTDEAPQPTETSAPQPAEAEAQPTEADAPRPTDGDAQPGETDPPQPADGEAQPGDTDPPQPTDDQGHAPLRLRLPAVLGVATVLLGGFGAWATVQAHNQRTTNAQQNLALTDGPATSAVRHQVSSAVQAIFSYSYTDTAKTRRDAQNLLTGPAIRQYDQLFSLVQKDAPAQKLVVTTSVTNSGVEFLTGSRARVLIFANQQDSRAGTGQTSYAGAMFAVTAVQTGGTWKISNIDTFTGG